MPAPETLTDRIYEAAVRPDCWPEVLNDLAALVDASGGALLLRRSDDWTGWRASKPFEAAVLDYMNTDIGRRTEAPGRTVAADRAGFVTTPEAYSPEEWGAEPLRAEWGRKWGFDQCAATAIHIPSGDFLFFHIQRREGEPPFNGREVGLLDSFRPHLARAGLLAARWRLERLRAAAEALALVGLPALVFDRGGHVLAGNALIEAMNEYLSWLPKDRIALVDPAADHLLRRALVGLSAGTAPTVQSFAVRPASGEAPAVVHLIPTLGQAQDLFDGALAILVVSPVTAPEAPNAALIRGLFDLTASEARVARGITRGLTIDEIATQYGVDRETIRTQIKAVFDKTGTRRQAEVASLLAGLPHFRS
jgi:DNA-binding CsgD family transcriptional regulator